MTPFKVSLRVGIVVLAMCWCSRGAFASLVPLPPYVAATVDAGTVIRTVDDRQFGLNATIWDGEFPSATTTNYLAAAGTRALRFPGGSLSDEYHWATNTTLNNTWTWAMNFDQFATVATSINAQVFVTANYGTGTPQEAADWVTYANVTKGYGFKYWEIGNECYGSWETDTQAVAHDPYTYAVRFKDYYTLMKAADPTVKVGMVGITGENAYANNASHPATNPRTGIVHNGWTPVVLTTLKSLGVTPDFLIYHRYDQAPGAESDAGLLQASQTWPNDAADLRQQLTDYLGAAGADVELVVTENNSVYSNPGKQTTSIVNALFLADSFGHLVQTEFNAMMWWDVRNGQDAANNNSSSLYGWRDYGDYGVLYGTEGAYPTYYAWKLLQHFARAGDQIVAASCVDPLVSVFAAKRTDGTLGILLINKHPPGDSSIQGVQISLQGFRTQYVGGTLYYYGVTSDDAARLGDVAHSDVAAFRYDAGSATSVGLSMGPYEMDVLNLDPETAPVFTVSPASQEIDIGASVTLAAETTAANITRQWRKNGVDLPGGVGETYSFYNATVADSGIYTMVATNGTGSTTSSPAVVIVGPRDGRLANLSTRGPVDVGDDVMIAGFVVGGTTPRTLLVRGVGPKLADYGVSGPLANPRIEIVANGATIMTNDDWETQLGGLPDVAPVTAAVSAFPFDAGSADAALVGTFDPGLYTAIVSGVGGTTGVALAELYDAGGNDATSRLLNLSTRGLVGTGGSIMIPGIVVSASGRRLLVRGVGPGLTGLVNSPVLSDPMLQVVDQQGNVIFENDDWGSAATSPEVAAAFTATGAFVVADDSRDAAMVVDLPPGQFTALVSGKAGATGLALVEVYEMAP